MSCRSYDVATFTYRDGVAKLLLLRGPQCCVLPLDALTFDDVLLLPAYSQICHQR